MTLAIEDVTKQYGDTIAVNNLRLHISTGQIFGLLGANGAGKTTTIRMILGLIRPTQGRITWNREKIDYSMSHTIGYLPEERGLYPKLTVKEQLIYFGKLRGIQKQDSIKEMKYWLERFRVEEYENKKVEELSKGNQQKIQFLAAIINRPELLFLDEPFSGLDPVNVEQLKEAVQDIAKRGTTIIFSSHRMDQVEELCKELCILHRGSPVVQGNLREVKRSFGKKNIHIHTDAKLGHIGELDGVTKVKQTAAGYVVQVTADEVSQRVLQEIVTKGFISHFSLEEPSLNDIFIEKVGGAYE